VKSQTPFFHHVGTVRGYIHDTHADNFGYSAVYTNCPTRVGIDGDSNVSQSASLKMAVFSVVYTVKPIVQTYLVTILQGRPGKL
jgi:hypothetical protein